MEEIGGKHGSGVIQSGYLKAATDRDRSIECRDNEKN